jgi:hypothetical protein
MNPYFVRNWLKIKFDREERNMVQFLQSNERIQVDDGYDLYPDKYVLLGYTKEYEEISGIQSGVVLAVGNRNDRDAIWDLYEDYFSSEKYGSLLVIYFGAVEASGVYV